MSHVERFASARVARMATVTPSGQPHIVPITFVSDGEHIRTPIDHKPKSGRRLQRLVNIAAEPRVSVIADHYDDDWARLWWARADGEAHLLHPGEAAHAVAASALASKYDEYAAAPLGGEIIEITVHHWTGWSARSDGPGAG